MDRSKSNHWVLAVAAVAAASAIRLVLNPLLGPTIPYGLFFLATAVVALFGAFLPALFATFLSAVVAQWLFIRPLYSFRIGTSEDTLALALFVLISIVISYLGKVVQRSRSAAERAAAASEEAKTKVEQVVRLLDLANLLVRDDDDRISYWSAGCSRLYGFTREEAVGRISHELLRTRFPEPLEKIKSQLLQKGRWEGEMVQRTADGREIQVTSEWVLQRDDNGFASTLEVNNDITARKEAETALLQSEELLRLAALAAQIGVWSWVPGTSDVFVSGNWRRLFGVDPSASVTFETWRDSLHPDDREAAVAELRSASKERRDFSVEYRVVWPDDTVHWLIDRGRATYNDAGEAIRMAGVNVDITERKRLEEELRAAMLSAERAKGIAEEANHAKDHFLAVLSHELRTPLTPVLAALALLKRENTLSKSALDRLELIRRNVELQARLIDDLLDLTRIVRGKVDLDKRKVELCTILDRAAEVCRPDLEARRLHFGTDYGSGPYLMDADAARLQQVFWNLLKNAIKFTPHGGCIGVVCRSDNGYVTVEVNDSGVGIEAPALAHIFDAFSQTPRSRQFGGLGLGLAISKALVEMHGGEIAAYSAGINKGATFTVRLPMVSSRVADEIGAVAEATGVPNGYNKSRRILLVEDHGDTAEMMVSLLMINGHEVKTAGDVETALDLAGRNDFDVLISDLGLPDGSGLDLVRELGARGRMLPAIALSGYGQEKDVEQSRAAGFVMHLVKPVNVDRLLEAIDKVS